MNQTLPPIQSTVDTNQLQFRSNLLRLLMLIACVAIPYIISWKISSPYRSENADIVFYGGLATLLCNNLYSAADIGYLISIFILVWVTGRFRWLTIAVMLPICFLGLGKFHENIFNGDHARYLNASLAAILAIATIPFAK